VQNGEHTGAKLSRNSLKTVSGAASVLSADDNAERVRVVVRVRPLNDEERSGGFVPCVKFPDAAAQIQTKLEMITNKPGRSSSKIFTVDQVIDPFSTQQAMFEKSGIVQLLDYALEGYAGTVFAYGQTGSGKVVVAIFRFVLTLIGSASSLGQTYTMSGDEERIGSGELVADAESAGLIPRAMQYLMERIKKAPPGIDYNVSASFIEVYNETPRDLLNPDSGQPRQHQLSAFPALNGRAFRWFVCAMDGRRWILR
jgi:hypothetical protein